MSVQCYYNVRNAFQLAFLNSSIAYCKVCFEVRKIQLPFLSCHSLLLSMYVLVYLMISKLLTYVYMPITYDLYLHLVQDGMSVHFIILTSCGLIYVHWHANYKLTIKFGMTAYIHTHNRSDKLEICYY